MKEPATFGISQTPGPFVTLATIGPDPVKSQAPGTGENKSSKSCPKLSTPMKAALRAI
jgi:hypothetical protein